MKPSRRRLRRTAGFTLVELLAGAAAASIVMGALMTGSLAVQRSLTANDQLARAQADLLRVGDYISRDVRNATSINTSSTSTVLLTVTCGDYYDQRGTPSNTADDIPNPPVLGRYGATYGASPVTIRYLRSGTRVAREVTRVVGGVSTTSTTWIGDNVNASSVAVDSQGTVTLTSSAAMTYRRQKAGGTSPSLSLVMASHPRNPTP
jgi:Tfp pilus assembly protein PilW